MPTSRPSELALRQYLLGRASEAEAEALENLYFEDSEVFDELTALDDALIEAYVDGSLTPEERDGFERTLAAFPRRQARLFLVRELAARASPVKTPAAIRTPGPRAVARPEPAWADSRLWQWGLLAATVALALAAAVLMRQTSLLRAELQEARRAPTTAGRASAGSEEARSRPEGPSVPPVSAPAATGVPSSATAPMLAMTLTPGLLRDAAIPVVTLSKDTLLVRFTLVFAAPSSEGHTIRLLSSAGDERWRENGVVPGRIGARAAVTVDLPARVLTGGEFVLEVSRGGDADRPESYHFRAILP